MEMTPWVLFPSPAAITWVRGGFSASSLPAGESQQASSAIQAGAGAAAHDPRHSIPAKSAPGGEGHGQHAPEQPLHVSACAGHQAGGGQAGKEAE